MKDKWNERYSTDEYFFGKDPNEFFKEIIDPLSPGKALFVGEGEGRNSVYAAILGWNVDALDISDVGKQKAEVLAIENNVHINYFIADAIDYNYPADTYDAIVLIYFHLESEQREEFFTKIITSLKPGGTLVLLVYDEDHIKNGNGGPSDINLFYTLENVAETFIDLEFVTFAKEQLSRTKKGRSQESTIIKFVGKKLNQN